MDVQRDGRMDGRTDPPCVLQDFVPFGAAAQKLQEKERGLHMTFVTSLGESNKFADYLTKVFKKRIKRQKKKERERGWLAVG